jgi:predicted P-loop ATPase
MTAGFACTCNREDCKDAGKHPRVTGWQTRDLDHTPVPGEGYGIATGRASGIFVVDVDGEDALRHLFSLGEIPPTTVVRTGRAGGDGYHLYFQYPPDEEIRNDQGRKLGHLKIDVRGEGGYVVGPGSPHKSGNVYEVLQSDPPAVAPEWMLSRLRATAAERRDAAASAPVPVDIESAEGERRIGLAYTFLDETAEPAVQGEGGSYALWIVAQTLVRTYELPLEVAAQLCLEIYNPRCSPPWSEQEIWHKLEDARDRGTWMCGCPSADFPANLVAAAHKPVRAPALAVGRTRMLPNPAHVYSFTPGDRPNGEKNKISFASATADLVTHQEWAGVMQWDEFHRKPYAINPPVRLDAERGGLSDEDGNAIAAWFEVNGTHLIGGDMAYKAAVQAARRNPYHPVKEYLDKVCAENTGPYSILDTLAERVFGATDPQANEFLKKTLVAAVRRIRSPGCQMDTVLVLHGGQGVKKSTFVRELFGPEFVRSQMPDLASKDASLALNGFWCIELAELTRIVNSESSTVKEFLTRPFDDYRPPYGRTDQRFARQCILIGTTNDQDFLSDATGNRRYLPIACIGKIDVEFVQSHKDEIWAEACVLEAAGYPHWFEDETAIEESRTPFVREDAWHSAIEDYLRGKESVKNEQVFRDVIMRGDGDLLKYTHKEQKRVADTLKRLGCTQKVVKIDGKATRLWFTPDAIVKLEPKAKRNLSLVKTE